MRYFLLAAMVAVGLGCSKGDNGAPGVEGMSVDKSGAIHDNKGNTYTAPPSSVAEKDFAVPFYPGSTGDGDDGGLADINQGTSRNLIANRITKDSVQQVIDFYKPKFPQGKVMGGGGNQDLFGDFSPTIKLSITASKEDRGTTVAISETIKK